jgi:hypothetical protein
MALSEKRDTLKEKIKDLIEEKTWYGDVNLSLDIEALNLKIRLAIYLIDHLDGTIDKRKRKSKEQEENRLLQEKHQEELEKLLDYIHAYFDDLREADRRQEAKKTYYTNLYRIKEKEKLEKLQESLNSILALQQTRERLTPQYRFFNKYKEHALGLITKLKNIPRNMFFMYSPINKKHAYVNTLEYKNKNKNKNKDKSFKS